MKEFVISRSKMLYCSIREWNVTLIFWGIVLLVEVVVNVLK
ncbi:hypothetical protein [Mucilaginibacter sp. OK098]|nr:hypothetical protein [Mucilaginibacter sp. OK098]SHM52942.1 hypothetical protein SAMN05216524_102411 [Mucilaginibacter sp. OK098]